MDLAFYCATCGQVQMRTEDLQAFVTTDNALAWVNVVCPICHRVVVIKSSPERVRTVLVVQGVTVTVVGAPAREVCGAADDPLTLDDLITLGLELQEFEGFDLAEGERLDYNLRDLSEHSKTATPLDRDEVAKALGLSVEDLHLTEGER